MSQTTNDAPAPSLAPTVLVVFLAFLAVGAPLPALALYVHDQLGFDAVTVGWIIGIQSIATVLTRHMGGTFSDQRGPRRAVLLGLPLAAISGLLYLGSALAPASPTVRIGILVVGRLLLGLAESLFLTGAMTWGIARVGAARTGRVMSWQGIALYAALGLGAPLGLRIQTTFGFTGVALFVVATPLLALALALTIPAVPASGGQRVPLHRVLGLIWRPGLVLTLATVPFAGMAAFLALHYATRGWSGAGLALGGFAAGYITVRLFGAHLPDKLGGATVAAGSLVTETVGQAILWLAPNPIVAFAGAALTGLGYSLVFPSMGVEATRRVRPEERGAAVGNFTAFFDGAIGLTGPIVGLAAARLGYSTAFLIGGMATLVALGVLPAVRRMGAR